MTNILLMLYTAIRILIYVVLGLGVLCAGIWSIMESQSDRMTRPYHEDMYMGMGIMALVIGVPIAWACLVHVVHLYRDF